MLIVLSPAKSINFDVEIKTDVTTQPDLLKDAEKLVYQLEHLSKEELSKLMGISNKLTELNYERYKTWHIPFNKQNARQAILSFNGDVYAGMKAESFNNAQLILAQKKVRILSGLYGVLRPLDLIQPYRLEMGTKFKYNQHKNLYEFWGNKITEKVQKAIDDSGNKILVNLASNEYYKSIDENMIDAKIITPDFKDYKNGKYKIISFYAKKARGMMTRFIIENNIDNPSDLQAFDLDGYTFNAHLSKEHNPVFTRH